MKEQDKPYSCQLPRLIALEVSEQEYKAACLTIAQMKRADKDIPFFLLMRAYPIASPVSSTKLLHFEATPIKKFKRWLSKIVEDGFFSDKYANPFENKADL